MVDIEAKAHQEICTVLPNTMVFAYCRSHWVHSQIQVMQENFQKYDVAQRDSHARGQKLPCFLHVMPVWLRDWQ